MCCAWILQQCHSPSQVLAAAGPSGLTPREINAAAFAQKLPGTWLLDPTAPGCPADLVISAEASAALKKRVDSIRKLLPQYHESFHHLSSGSATAAKRWSLALFDLPGPSQDLEAERAGQRCYRPFDLWRSDCI